MMGLGTIINAVAIIVGSLIGLVVGRNIPERVRGTLIKVAGLFTLAIGIKMFFRSEQLILVLFSLFVGGLIGEWANIEKYLESFGLWLKSVTKSRSESFLDGFVTTSLIYCVGPMAILGAISDGMGSQYDILLIKSVLDGTASVAFAAGLGIGAFFSFIPVLLYQGVITILAAYFGRFFSEAMIFNMTAAGGLLITGIGVNLLGGLKENKRIPVGNLLPALVFAVIFTMLMPWVEKLTDLVLQ